MNALDVISILLRPKPLRALANGVIRAIVPAVVSRHGVRVALNRNDPVLAGALTFGVYENTEIRFFTSLCRPGLTVLDIGAHVGLFTALALKGLSSNGRVFSVEPDPVNVEYLKQTIRLNGGGATLVEAALSDRESRMPLFLSAENRGDNRMYSDGTGRSTVEVEVTSVDRLAGRFHLSSVDLIKMDVQGYEGHVFRGMTETVARSPHLLILMEFWPQGLQEAGTDPAGLLEALRKAGFHLFELQDRRPLTKIENPAAFTRRLAAPRYANIVAVKDPAWWSLTVR